MRQLEVFVALLEQGSFTQAAHHLGLSQPTVSGHMADLEGRLGMRLVERVRSGVRPTPEGETLLRPARDALRGEYNLRLAAAEIRGLVAGSLSVGGSSIPAVYLLPERLAAFRENHPKVRLRLETGSSQEMLDALLQGSVEIAVTGATTKRRGLRVAKIADDRLVLICHPDHEFARRKRTTLDECRDQTLILRRPGSGTRQAMLTGLGISHPERELRSFLEVEGTDGVKAATRAGLGISFVSEFAVKDELENGHLVAVPVDDFATDRAFWVVTRAESMLSPAATAFLGILAPELATSPDAPARET